MEVEKIKLPVIEPWDTLREWEQAESEMESPDRKKEKQKSEQSCIRCSRR